MKCLKPFDKNLDNNLDNNIESIKIANTGYHIIESISEMVNKSYDINVIVNSVLEQIRDLYKLSFVRILERTDSSFNLKCTYISQTKNIFINVDTLKSVSVHIKESRFFKNDPMLDKGYVIYNSSDINDIDYLRETTKMYNPESILQIPILFQDNLLGILELIDCTEERAWTSGDIMFVQTILRVLVQYMYGLDAFSYLRKSSDKYDYVTSLEKYSSFSQFLDDNMKLFVSQKYYAVVCFDIQQFKLINDKLGFSKGNFILRQTAICLKKSPDIVRICRIHSDNFVAVIKFEGHDKSELPEIVRKLSNDISVQMKNYIPEVNIQIYSGIYVLDEENVSAEAAYTNANIARKASKVPGGSNAVVFEPKMMAVIRRQEELNSKFAKALKNKNLIVYYQPKISCTDESVVGGEALIRWRNDDGTFIYPDEFISSFEKNGNIIDLDYYVYREVFSYLKKRIDNNQKVVPVSMNVSRMHLNNDKIIGYIKSLFEEFDVPPELIEFELTENIYMSNMTNARKFMDFCKSIKVFVSMDDFGSGFSSLNVMNTLPIDILKLDRVFLKNEILTENDKIVLECIVSMAKKLKMKVICEGVETHDQSEFLKKIQCDMIQGYYYGRPMSEESFNKYIEEHYVEK